MLAQGSLGASVCLRCRLSQARLRLGRLPALPFAATSTTVAAASFTTSIRRSRADDSLEVPDVAAPEIRKEFNPLTPYVRRVQSKQVDKDAPTDGKSKSRPLRRGRGGKKIKDLSAPLKQQYLEGGSEVLILRDVIEPPQDSEAGEPVENDTRAAERRQEIRQILEESIASQSAVPGQEEVNEHINKIRPVSTEGPHYPAFVTREELQNIVKALKGGYTVAQLRRYAAVTESLEQLEELNRVEKSELGFKWISTWQEGVTSIDRRLPDPDEIGVPVEKLTKMKLVDRIVRGIWNVGVIEENEAIGEIEVKLEPWQFDLLLNSNRQSTNYTILDNIGHQRRVRIESYRPESIVRFIAEKENTEQAITDLRRALRKFRTLIFNLGDFESLSQKRGQQYLMDFFSEKDLEVTERLSNTFLDTSSNSKLVIHGTDWSSIELARRILLSIIDPPSAAESNIMADTEGEGFVQATSTESALHYRYRRKQYGRWTFPVQRESKKRMDKITNPGAESTTTSQESLGDQAEQAVTSTADTVTASNDVELGPLTEKKTSEIEEVNDRSELVDKVVNYLTSPVDGRSSASAESFPATKNARTTYWSPHTLLELYANYGNVLHKPSPANTSLTPISLPDLLSHSERSSRTFLHAVPGFSPFLQYMTAKTRFNHHFNEEKLPDTLLFRFMPAPWDIEDPSSLEDFPDLGLRIQVNKGTGRARFQGLGLTVRERNMDVLLPRQAVDLRFVRREVVWTKDALLRSEELRDYLSMINTSLTGGGSIRAPAKLTLRIPAWTVRNPDKYSSLPTETTEHGKEFVKEFVFSAIEHRQMVKFDVPDSDHRVSYTSVEAGRLGGRRGELRIRLRKPANNSDDLNARVPGLVKEAFDIASWINDAVYEKLPAPAPPKIKKVHRHSSFLRLTSDGRLIEPSPYNTDKEVKDEEVESGGRVEKEAASGGGGEQAPASGDEAVSQGEDLDSPLKEGAN